MKKILVIFTRKFPFDAGEDFIEKELEISKLFFDQIIIIPTNVEEADTVTKKIDSDIFVYPLRSKSVLEKLSFYVKYGIQLLWESQFYRELLQIRSVQEMKEVIAFGVQSKRIEKFTIRKVGRDPKSSFCFYSYWFLEGAKAAGALQKKYNYANAVTRAHGYDLYQERRETRFPYQEKKLKQIGQIYTCSQNGMQYLQDRYPQYASKIKVSYLGVDKLASKEYKYQKGRFHLVTCSNLVPVKRLNRLTEVLREIDISWDEKRKITWTCIGEGPMREELQEVCSEFKNIEVKFLGRKDNKEIHKLYAAEDIDLFINVSESEGLPVSIMEAGAYGIPVLATNVGGTAEIVTSGENGFLLQKDFSNQEFADFFFKIYNMEEAKYIKLRENSYHIWNTKFSAIVNYKKFYSELVKKMK